MNVRRQRRRAPADDPTTPYRVAVALVALAGFAPAQDLEWVRQFNAADHTGHHEDTVVEAVDADGCVVVAGTVEGIFAPSSAEDFRGSDMFVRKYDPDGQVIWTRHLTSQQYANELVTGIATGGGDVYVTGYSGFGFPGFDGGAFVLKYSAAGDLCWIDQFDIAGWGQTVTPFDVEVMSGGVVIAGRAYGALPGQSSVGWTDAFVRMYDADGSEVWTRQFGVPQRSCWITGVCAASGRLYALGRTTGALPGQVHRGSYDSFLRCFDDQGNELWTRQFGSPAADFASKIGVTGATLAATVQEDGESLVRGFDLTGAHLWSASVGPWPTVNTISIVGGQGDFYVAGYVRDVALSGQTYLGGESDAFVRKYSAAGDAVWTRTLGTPDAERALGLGFHGESVYVGGWTRGELPGNVRSQAARDSFVFKYSSLGDPCWVRQFAGHRPQRATGRAVAAAGQVYVAAGELFDGVSGNVANLLVFQYDAQGNQVWSRRFDENKDPTAAAVDGTGLYLTGAHNGQVADIPSQHGQGGWIRKFDHQGHELWTRNESEGVSGFPYDVALEADAVYVVGSEPFANHNYLTRLDPSGTMTWRTDFEFGSQLTRAYSLALHGDRIWAVGTVRHPYPEPGEAVLWCFDRAGQFLFDVREVHQPRTSFWDVAANADGVYVAGAASTESGPNNDSFGFVRKLDPSGQLLWEHVIDSPQFDPSSWNDGVDYVRTVTCDSGGVLITGSTNGDLEHGSVPSTIEPADVFAARIDSSGARVWLKQFGTTEIDAVDSAAVDGCGIYIAGSTWGEFPGSSSIDFVDVFLAKVGHNEAPVAVPGPDLAITAGTLVELDGSASFDDNTPSGLLAYGWQLLSTPAGSAALLAGAATPTASFFADAVGTYVLALVVSDEWGVPSEPAFVTVSSANLPPSAAAGMDLVTFVGDTVELDGNASADPNGQPLAFHWTLVEAPSGSQAVLSDATSPMPRFTVDVEGLYTAALQVHDGWVLSEADTVDVWAMSTASFAQARIMDVSALACDASQAGAFATSGLQVAFCNHLHQALLAIAEGRDHVAIQKLENARFRSDGFVLTGAVQTHGPGRDWILDGAVQNQVYGGLSLALDALVGL